MQDVHGAVDASEEAAEAAEEVASLAENMEPHQKGPRGQQTEGQGSVQIGGELGELPAQHQHEIVHKKGKSELMIL